MRFKRASLPALLGVAFALSTGCSLVLGAPARHIVATTTTQASTAPPVKSVTASLDLPLIYLIPGGTNIPVRWFFTRGWTLASVRIGDTQGNVKAILGTPYVCSQCKTLVWVYIYGHAKPHGIGVEFNVHGRVAELFGLPGPRRARP
jgi:hypothetical protein